MFSDYVQVSCNPKNTVEDKFALALSMGFVSENVDQWILEDVDDAFGLCDFIAPGGFPAFLSSGDAKSCFELVKEHNEVEFHMHNRQREGVSYWYLD